MARAHRRTDRYVFTFFGFSEEEADRLIEDRKWLDDAWPLGGMHMPIPHLGAIAYNKTGHLTAIVLTARAVHPGFFLTSDDED